MRARSARQGKAFNCGLVPQSLRLEGISGLALEIAAPVPENPLEYTVIGDTVNTADRIERLTRTAGVSSLVSDEVLAAAGMGSSDPSWKEETRILSVVGASR